MNTKLTLSALLIAALPLVAQAGTAAERALALHQEPLSTLNQGFTEAPHATSVALGGDSAAMQKARAALQAKGSETRFADSGDALRLGREATS